jgi:hypothetical protein
VALIYYAVMNMIGTTRKLDQIYSGFNPLKDAKSTADSAVFADSAYLALLKDRAWLQSRTIMAETDSIYLTINLEDSTADLAINGVMVHSSPIEQFRLSRIFTKGNKAVLYTMLSAPLSVVSSESSIRKEPLMIKMAPKDTSEYKPDIVPDTTHTKPVNFVLNMSGGIRIFFYQDDHNVPGDRLSRFLFDFRQRTVCTWDAIKSVALLKIPEYHPYIKLYVSGTDGRIIYRAIPRNGQLTILL